MKSDHHMDRCWLQGALGDALHSISCAAGYNLRWLLSLRIVIMTARPGRVAHDIANDLPHPRNANVQLSDLYIKLKQQIWGTVQAEVVRSMEASTAS